jgi:hypothetical protein
MMKRKINKANLNYFVDSLLTLGFLISIGTGFILIGKPSAGFQGGRNSAYADDLFGVSLHWWKSLHTWSSILMAGGVFVHLLLHAKWIACMTKNIFKKKGTVKAVWN